MACSYFKHSIDFKWLYFINPVKTNIEKLAKGQTLAELPQYQKSYHLICLDLSIKT